MDELRPCPFCGNDGIAWADNPSENCPTIPDMPGCYIECELCLARTQVYSTEEAAARAWNRRPE